MNIKRTAQIVHNPKAGSSAEKYDLIELVRANGFECVYTSTADDGWSIEPSADFVVVAGGDGTVRKVAMRMLDDTTLRKPIALLPMGTANNISKTLGIEGEKEALAARWRKWHIKSYDTADIAGLMQPAHLVESIGFGLFPYLMKQVAGKEPPGKTPEQELKWVQKTMLKIARNYKGRRCRLLIDGVQYSGNYLMVEVMNICSVGANLHLNPGADVGDNRLEVVMIPVTDRAQFAQYLLHKVKGGNDPFKAISVQCRQVKVRWSGKLCHLDDKLQPIRKNKCVKVQVRQHSLEFLV